MPKNIANRLPFEMKNYFLLIRASSALQMAWGTAATVLAMMICFGIAFPQPPFSDFEIHWDQSQNLDTYIKGGLSSLIYKFVSAFASDDWKTALFVNLISWIVFVFAILPHKKDTADELDQNRLLKFVLVASIFFYGFWWVSMSSTVAIFPVHLALFSIGIKMALDDRKKSKFFRIFTIIVLSFAFSMRMQTVLAVFLGGGLLLSYFAFVSLIKKEGWLFRQSPLIHRFSVIIAISITIGVMAEIMLRYNSSNDAEIKRSQRAQLYNGLFQPFSKPNHCGGWTQTNWDSAMEERDIPMTQLFEKYITRNPPSFYFKAAMCKYDRLVNSKVYVWWVPRISYENWRSGSIIQNYENVRQYIKFNNLMLKLCLSFLIVYVLITKRKHSSLGTLLLSSIILGLVMTFGMLEFNYRYSFLLIGYFFIYFGLKHENGDLRKA